MLTRVAIEEQIMAVSNDLEEATIEYEQRARTAAVAEVTHKVAQAKAFVGAEGSVAQREALATLAVEHLLMDRQVASAVLASHKEAMNTLRARLDALRSLSASVRAQT